MNFLQSVFLGTKNFLEKGGFWGNYHLISTFSVQTKYIYFKSRQYMPQIVFFAVYYPETCYLCTIFRPNLSKVCMSDSWGEEVMFLCEKNCSENHEK